MPNDNLVFHLILNGYWEPLDFELPSRPADAPWRRWIDTSLLSPDDITEWQSARPIDRATYRSGPRSVVMLFASRDRGGEDPS